MVTFGSTVTGSSAGIVSEAEAAPWICSILAGDSCLAMPTVNLDGRVAANFEAFTTLHVKQSLSSDG